MNDVVLVVNTGSSSIKFALYGAAGDTRPLVDGAISDIGREPDFVARDEAGRGLAEGGLGDIGAAATHGELIVRLMDWLGSRGEGLRIVAAGHRVVHGGQDFSGPVRIDAGVLDDLRALVPLAPLHQPHNLAAIDVIAEHMPDLPQVACFDTAFHRTLPRLAQLFGLPRALSDDGIIAYGFHGLSYDYIAGVLPDHLGARAEGRVIVAHLGNGASMCAMKQRRSVATTMGFTALHGLVMGSRCGTLDAGIVLHLVQQQGMDADRVERLLYRESGLLGVSGISNDMQDLEESGEAQAEEAIDLFCYRAAAEAGALAAATEGLDALVFTAGIGENSRRVRRDICNRLAWLGVELDEAANEGNETVISTPASGVAVLVVPTDEELVIARATRALLG